MRTEELPPISEQFPRLRLGISACLLGQEVRYDGGHKRYHFVTDSLSEYADYLPICPEVAAGLGVPRPPIQLVGSDPRTVRALNVRDPKQDVTESLQHASRQTLSRLQELDGYILKKDSPSCGMERVKLYSCHNKAPKRMAQGLFARELLAAYPLLPVEEEGRLNDPVLRENFVNRLYVWNHWRQLRQEPLQKDNLVRFHSANKYLVMAHSQAAYKRMGQLLSDLNRDSLEQIAQHYIEELMAALKRRVSRLRHVNVLQHILGHLKRQIDADSKRRLLASIHAYQQGKIPLAVPISLLRHYLRNHPDTCMAAQRYLRSHPEALALRNQI